MRIMNSLWFQHFSIQSAIFSCEWSSPSRWSKREAQGNRWQSFQRRAQQIHPKNKQDCKMVPQQEEWEFYQGRYLQHDWPGYWSFIFQIWGQSLQTMHWYTFGIHWGGWGGGGGGGGGGWGGVGGGGGGGGGWGGGGGGGGGGSMQKVKIKGQTPVPFHIWSRNDAQSVKWHWI